MRNVTVLCGLCSNRHASNKIKPRRQSSMSKNHTHTAHSAGHGLSQSSDSVSTQQSGHRQGQGSGAQGTGALPLGRARGGGGPARPARCRDCLQLIHDLALVGVGEGHSRVSPCWTLDGTDTPILVWFLLCAEPYQLSCHGGHAFAPRRGDTRTRRRVRVGGVRMGIGMSGPECGLCVNLLAD